MERKPKADRQFPIAELFGFPDTNLSETARAARSRRFCPFINSQCTKVTGHAQMGPIGTCSVRYRGQTVIVCPQRFRGDNHVIARAVASQAFGAEAPIKLVREVVVKTGTGERWSLDYVAAEMVGEAFGKIIGIEDQAIDTTGSVVPFVQAYLEGRTDGQPWHTYGLNWANVYKRIIPQVARKGRIFEAWGSQLYVVIQDVLLGYIGKRIAVRPAQPGESVNLIFQAYRLQLDGNAGKNILVPAETLATTVRRLDEAYQASAALPLRSQVEKAIQAKPAL
jgi:hypothetical protein